MTASIHEQTVAALLEQQGNLWAAGDQTGLGHVNDTLQREIQTTAAVSPTVVHLGTISLEGALDLQKTAFQSGDQPGLAAANQAVLEAMKTVAPRP